MSKEELESSYKKALKSLEGEKRSAIKKAKGIKGKKGKEALALVEKDFTDKLKALEASHQENVAALGLESMNISEVSTNIENASTTIDDENKPAVVVDEETEARERKIKKSRKKKDRQKEKEAEIQKGKEALALVEKDFTDKLKALEASHQENVAALGLESMNISEVSTNIENASTTIDDENKPAVVVDEETEARERKIKKSRKKKDRQKEKEAEIQKEIEEENANAGPGLRKIELEQIQQVLTPLNLKVSEVDADGHCLYRAVAAQSGKDFMAIRKLAFSGRLCCIYHPIFFPLSYAYFVFSHGFLT